MEAEFEALKHLLDDSGVKYSVLTHEKVFTSEEAAQTRGVPLSSGVKAMVVKTKIGFLMVLVPGDRKLDFRKLGKTRLASVDDVLRITNCEPGSVHPFGLLFGLRVFMDRRILDNATVNFNAGMHEISINMNPKDMIEIIKPVIGDYSVPKL